MLSCGRLFATPWSVACQVPLSMEFSRQEYWSGLPFPSPGESTNLLLSNIWAIIYSWSMKYFLKSTNCCSVTQSFPTLCRPMGREAHQASLSFTVSQSLLKFMSTESVTLSNHFILCCPLVFCLQFFSASGSFQMSQLFASSGQSIAVSALASVLPMNTQDWSPLVNPVN